MHKEEKNCDILHAFSGKANESEVKLINVSFIYFFFSHSSLFSKLRARYNEYKSTFKECENFDSRRDFGERNNNDRNKKIHLLDIHRQSRTEYPRYKAITFVFRNEILAHIILIESNKTLEHHTHNKKVYL